MKKIISVAIFVFSFSLIFPVFAADNNPLHDILEGIFSNRKIEPQHESRENLLERYGWMENFIFEFSDFSGQHAFISRISLRYSYNTPRSFRDKELNFRGLSTIFGYWKESREKNYAEFVIVSKHFNYSSQGDITGYVVDYVAKNPPAEKNGK